MNTANYENAMGNIDHIVDYFLIRGVRPLDFHNLILEEIQANMEEYVVDHFSPEGESMFQDWVSAKEIYEWYMPEKDYIRLFYEYNVCNRNHKRDLLSLVLKDVPDFRKPGDIFF